jgi:hypothetical protein
MAARATRFRWIFWVVVALGALPSLVSGLVLQGSYRLANLCGGERPVIDVPALQARLRWERLHDWGRVGALVAGLLAISYGVAWAFEAPLSRGRRALIVSAALLLLFLLATATFSGRALPWRALEPAVSLAPAAAGLRAAPEWGGPAWCTAHADEVARLGRLRAAHLFAGAAAVALTLALCDLGARWRAARDARGDQGRDGAA